MTIAIKHVSEAPIAPRVINPNVPDELEQVILWALNKDPADRPTDAEQLIEALEQVKEMIVSGSKGQRTTSFAAVAAAGRVLHRPRRTRRRRSRTPRRPRRRRTSPTAMGQRSHRTIRSTGGGGGRGSWPRLAVLLLAGGGAAAYLLTRPEKVGVPTVVLEGVNVAQANIQNAGLTPSLIYRTDSHRSGKVIAQSPLGGVKVNKGSTVTLTVSQGPGNTTVPSVTGLTLNQAKQELKQSGLNLARTQSETSDAVPAGRATRTDPQAGSSFPVSGAVTLFISSGKPNVNVPDVTGETQAAATSNLKSAGFTVSRAHQSSTTVAPGTVISQNPAGGTSATSGSNVNLVIAQAPPKVNVPNVVGKKPGGAKSALTSAGFTVSELSQRRHRPGAGRGRDQPEPGRGQQPDEGKRRHDRGRPLHAADHDDDRHDRNADHDHEHDHHQMSSLRVAVLGGGRSVRARGVDRVGGLGGGRAGARRARGATDRDRPRRRVARGSGPYSRSAPGGASRAPTSCSRCCTGRSARTAPCRACSSASTCRTSAPACSRRRCAWTRSCSRS